MFLGSPYCPTKSQSYVGLQLIYADLATQYVEESESYPFAEMINELAGIAGFFFGISVLSFLALYEKISRKFHGGDFTLRLKNGVNEMITNEWVISKSCIDQTKQKFTLSIVSLCIHSPLNHSVNPIFISWFCFAKFMYALLVVGKSFKLQVQYSLQNFQVNRYRVNYLAKITIKYIVKTAVFIQRQVKNLCS